MTTILTKTEQWKGLKQGFERTQERTIKGRKTVEVVYGITRLSRTPADPRRLLELTRQHLPISRYTPVFSLQAPLAPFTIQMNQQSACRL